MKLRVTITSEWEVQDLSHYGAATIEEAVAFTQQQIDDGDFDLVDVIAAGETWTWSVAPVA